jgi:hypothetical protein
MMVKKKAEEVNFEIISILVHHGKDPIYIFQKRRN